MTATPPTPQPADLSMPAWWADLTVDERHTVYVMVATRFEIRRPGEFDEALRDALGNVEKSRARAAVRRAAGGSVSR